MTSIEQYQEQHGPIKREVIGGTSYSYNHPKWDTALLLTVDELDCERVLLENKIDKECS